MLKICFITYRLVVLGFFRRNYYVFLILFFLLFGLVYPPLFFFSEVFAKMIFGAPSVLVGIVLLSLAYTFWTGWVLGRLPHKAENQYVRVIRARGNRAMRGWALWISLGVQSPLFLFLGTHAVHGLIMEDYGSYLLLGTIFLGWLIPSFLLVRSMDGYRNSLVERWPLKLPLGRVTRNLPILYLAHLFRQHRLVILFTKLLSITLIIGVLELFLSEPSQGQVLHLPFLLLIVFHSLIPYWIFKAEDKRMPWVRTLPISLSRRFMQMASVYVLLALPETLILLNYVINFGYSPLALLDLLVGFSGILLLLHALLYTARTDLLSYTKGVFGIFFLLFIALLFKATLLAIGIVLTLLSAIVYFNSYYQWDPRPE